MSGSRPRDRNTPKKVHITVSCRKTLYTMHTEYRLCAWKLPVNKEALYFPN